MKRCAKCGEKKPLDDFYPIHGTDRRASYCKPCKKAVNAAMLARLRALPEDETASERFWPKVEKTDGCWIWKGSVWHLYGNFFFRGKVWQAHRVSWVLSGRELPAKPLVLDHMCRNKTCVNPDHLRVVTPYQNATENNVGPHAKNAQKTHCKHGHPFTPENTAYYTPPYTMGPRGGKRYPGRPTRVCLACKAARKSPRKQTLYSQFNDGGKP